MFGVHRGGSQNEDRVAGRHSRQRVPKAVTPLKQRLAKRLYEIHFDDSWDSLHPNSIERAMFLGMAQAAIEMCEAEREDQWFV